MFKSSPLLLPFPQALCFLFAIKLLGTQSCGLPGMLAYSPLKLVSPWSPLASFLPVPLASLLSLGIPLPPDKSEVSVCWCPCSFSSVSSLPGC